MRDRLELAALSLANPVAYAIRRALRFSRAGYCESRKSPLCDQAARAALTRHSLLPLIDHCSEWTLDSVLHALDLLEQVFVRFPPMVRDRQRVLDVGTKNAELSLGILAALGAFAPHRAAIEFTGIELDAHRVYASLHSRADAAEYFLGLARALGFTAPHRFLAGDVLDHTDRYDLVTWFLPFLSEAPLLRWGLTRRHLDPEPMLRHVIARLDRGGLLVIVNQEPEEDTLQRRLLAEVGADAASFTIESAFPRKHRACYVHVVRDRADATP